MQQRVKDSQLLEDSGKIVVNNDVAIVDGSGESPVFRMDEQYRPLLFNTIKRRSDTSYVFCTEVQFFPGTATSEDDRHLSLVFPSDASDPSAGLKR